MFGTRLYRCCEREQFLFRGGHGDDLRGHHALCINAGRERMRRGQFIKPHALAIGRPLRRSGGNARPRSQSAEPVPVRVNDVDTQLLRMLPSRLGNFVRLEVEISVRGERDPLAVGRPRRPEKAVQLARRRLQGRCARQIAQLARPEIHYPDVGRMRAAGRNERHLIPVWRKCRLIVKRWVVGEALQPRPIHAYAIEIGFAGAVAFGGKHDPFAIRRKGCVIVESGGGKQRMFAGAIDVGDVERHLRRT